MRQGMLSISVAEWQLRIPMWVYEDWSWLLLLVSLGLRIPMWVYEIAILRATESARLVTNPHVGL